MTARPACQSARPLPDGGFPLVLRAWAGLRQLALCILLIAFAALVLQAPAEAGAGPHAPHRDHAGMTGHCPGHDEAQASDRAPDCADDMGGMCCQACLAVVLPAGPPPVALPQAGESFRQEALDLRARSPDRLLRPPRPGIL